MRSKTYQKILERSRKSLYRFPVQGMSEAQVFLFAGWLRLEEKAEVELCREYRLAAKRSQKRRTVVEIAQSVSHPLKAARGTEQDDEITIAKQ